MRARTILGRKGADMYYVPLDLPPRSRELAERSSNGTHVRLLWRQGTGQLWVEVREPDEQVLAIPVQPERALDAFHHPYAYAAARRPEPLTESLVDCECGNCKEDQ
jgi:hypothetical protein